MNDDERTPRQIFLDRLESLERNVQREEIDPTFQVQDQTYIPHLYLCMEDLLQGELQRVRAKRAEARGEVTAPATVLSFHRGQPAVPPQPEPTTQQEAAQATLALAPAPATEPAPAPTAIRRTRTEAVQDHVDVQLARHRRDYWGFEPTLTECQKRIDELEANLKLARSAALANGNQLVVLFFGGLILLGTAGGVKDWHTGALLAAVIIAFFIAGRWGQ